MEEEEILVRIRQDLELGSGFCCFCGGAIVADDCPCYHTNAQYMTEKETAHAATAN